MAGGLLHIRFEWFAKKTRIYGRAMQSKTDE
jgi:hypothetical protein